MMLPNLTAREEEMIKFWRGNGWTEAAIKAGLLNKRTEVADLASKREAESRQLDAKIQERKRLDALRAKRHRQLEEMIPGIVASLRRDKDLMSKVKGIFGPGEETGINITGEQVPTHLVLSAGDVEDKLTRGAVHIDAYADNEVDLEKLFAIGGRPVPGTFGFHLWNEDGPIVRALQKIGLHSCSSPDLRETDRRRVSRCGEIVEVGHCRCRARVGVTLAEDPPEPKPAEPDKTVSYAYRAPSVCPGMDFIPGKAPTAPV
jgi:hypothetical protein